MSLIIFFIILSALVIVHELGHFLVAKYFGIRVDEFGLGFPPRAKTLFSWRGTLFTLNWLPFGGFVKIFGENPESNSAESPDNFQAKNRGIQALVLVAGVVGNFLFAWVLISVGLMIGVPAPADYAGTVEDARTVITMVVSDSPASEAGLKSGDTILELIRGEKRIPADAENVLLLKEASDFIAESFGPINFVITRGKVVKNILITPTDDILPDQPAVGISMELVGILTLPPLESIWQGFKTTCSLSVLTTKSLIGFVSQAIVGKADLSAVTGPVGIVGMVGDVRELGFSYLLSFTALISINLAIINLLPFPALDGGRLLFVGIETITRRSVPSKIFNAFNTLGFALLLLLMLIVTIQDVRNIWE